MANYNNLKATINANIKANGNEEITGPILNTVLNQAVTTLGAGYQYMGVATPATSPGTPDANVFYIAATPGTYTNFGGKVVADGEVAILKYNGSWAKEVTGAATAAQVTQLGQEVGKKLSNNQFFFGTDVDFRTYPNRVSNTASLWVFKETGYAHITKIRFKAREGTIYFYIVKAGVIATNLYTSKTLITSVVNTAGEEGTIKEISVDINLNEGEYIGVNGPFYYTTASLMNTDVTFNTDASTDKITVANGSIAVAVMAIGTIMDETIVFTKTIDGELPSYGPILENPSRLGNDNYIFWNEDSASTYPTYVRSIRLKLDPTTQTRIYRITKTGTTASVELLYSLLGTAEFHTIPVNVALTENQRIGISGRLFYTTSAADARWSYYYTPIAGGNVTKQGNGSALDFTLQYKNIEDDNSDARLDNEFIVDAAGNGDFLSVWDALVGTYGMDTAEHPIHIKVMPGVYDEGIHLRADVSQYGARRHVSIVGVDKVNCVLRTDDGYYNTSNDSSNRGDSSVLRVGGSVYVANLTIIATDQDNASETDGVYHRSYCVHSDFAATGEGETFEIHNCHLINNHAPCVGFGITKGCTLKITDSILESTLWDAAFPFGQAAIYGHDRNGGSSSVVEEHFIMQNCIVKCTNGNAVKSYDSAGALMDFIFAFNACDLPAGKGIVLATTGQVIAPSFGNNIEAMNA